MKIYRQNTSTSLKIYVAQKHLPTKQAIFDNILSIYNAADKNAESWYLDANNWAQSLADKYNCSLETVVGVCAAISPVTKWSRNMLATEISLQRHKAGLRLDSQSHGVQLHRNKAQDILDGKPRKLGKKTENFYLNIMLDSQAVTVDSIAMAIAIGLADMPGTYKFSDKVYDYVADIYREVAQHIGIDSPKLQAITWEHARNLRTKNKYSFLLQLAEKYNGATVDVYRNAIRAELQKLG